MCSINYFEKMLENIDLKNKKILIPYDEKGFCFLNFFKFLIERQNYSYENILEILEYITFYNNNSNYIFNINIEFKKLILKYFENIDTFILDKVLLKLFIHKNFFEHNIIRKYDLIFGILEENKEIPNVEISLLLKEKYNDIIVENLNFDKIFFDYYILQKSLNLLKNNGILGVVPSKLFITKYNLKFFSKNKYYIFIFSIKENIFIFKKNRKGLSKVYFENEYMKINNLKNFNIFYKKILDIIKNNN